MVNRIWPTAVAGKADSVSSVSASACHIGGPNSVNHGEILLQYGTLLEKKTEKNISFLDLCFFNLEFFYAFWPSWRLSGFVSSYPVSEPAEP